MSYVRQLLYSIADEIGRSKKDMDQYVVVFQKNWYDSKESLQKLNINDYDKLDIPRRLSGMIIERVSYGQPSRQRANESARMQEQFSMHRCLQSLKKHVSAEKFNFSVDTLMKIFRNIRDNLTQQKYRILKKSNEKIGQLIAMRENYEMLKYGGFEDTRDAMVMKNVNLGRIDECLDSLVKYHQGSKFDPYKVTMTSTTGNQNNYGGESSVIYNDKLEELEKQREKIMSKPIKDREIKIYRYEKKGELKPDSKWNDEREFTLEEKQYADSIKEKLKHFGEDPKFMNRRKQEYIDLMKKSCYSETIVRVKCPDNWIFQCKFSPLETLNELVKIFHEHLQNKNISYYLYMTPPVQKLQGMILRQTFYEKDCVPSALFYFGSEDNINTNVLKVKKTSTFGGWVGNLIN